MSGTTGTTLCPRCGAPIPWDGVAQRVNCPYCQIIVTPGGAPRLPNAAMVQPRGGAGAAGCIVAAVVGAVVLFGGGLGALFFMKSKASTAPVAVTAVTAPIVITVPTIMTTSGTLKTAALPPLRTFGEPGNAPGQLSDARSVAVDMDENVFVADYADARVQKFDSTGKFQWIIQVPKNSFSGDTSIWNMTVDTKNVLWVSRTGDLLKYADADGKALGSIKGNYDSSWFHFIALDPVGNIASEHTAAGDSALLLLDANGKLKKSVKINDEIGGLAVDGAGNVYLSERGEGVIAVYDSSGALKTRFGSKKDKHTSGASALAVDGKNHLFIATDEGVGVFDQGGGFIKKIETHGSLRSIAISIKNNLVILGNDKVTVFEIGDIP